MQKKKYLEEIGKAKDLNNGLEVEDVEEGNDSVDSGDDEGNDTSCEGDDEAEESGEQTTNSGDKSSNGGSGKSGNSRDEEEDLGNDDDKEAKDGSELLDAGDEANGVSDDEFNLSNSTLEDNNNGTEALDDNIDLNISLDGDGSGDSIDGGLDISDDGFHDDDSGPRFSTGDWEVGGCSGECSSSTRKSNIVGNTTDHAGKCAGIHCTRNVRDTNVTTDKRNEVVDGRGITRDTRNSWNGGAADETVKHWRKLTPSDTWDGREAASKTWNCRKAAN